MMPSTSNTRKKRGSDADSVADSNNSVSSKSNSDSKPSSSPATNLPSSTSGTSTTLTGGAGHQTTHSAIPPLAAVAAQTAPAAPTSGKKSRKAGFREQFLQQLRVMLDRESLNDDSPNPNPIQWSTDGSAFTINDQNRFEEIIPAYFGNKIAFASFLRKLQRWGFKRVSSNRRKGHYEFCLPAFKRMDVVSSTPAASSDSNTSSNNFGLGASIQFHQQPQTSSLLHQFMSQLSQTQTPAINPLPSLANANANPDNISNSQHSSQYPSTASQHSVNINSANYNRILQNIVGGSQQQPFPGQQSMPDQQPLPNQSGGQQNNSVGINNYLQPSQQWQYSNPAMNPVNVLGNNPFLQSNVLGALIGLLSGLLSLPSVANMNTSPAESPINIMSVIPFLAMLQQLNEEEQRRRAQVDALNQTIIATLGHLVGSYNTGDGRTQNGSLAALGHGSTGITQNMQLTNPSGMTVYVENNSTAQCPQQVDIPPQSVGDSNNIRADSISAILQVARQRGDATEPFEVGPHSINNHANDNTHNKGQDGNGNEAVGQPPEVEQYDDYDGDDDSWNIRLRPRKKSPPK